MNHPLMADLYSLYTRHAFEFMLHQSMLSHEVEAIWEKRQPESLVDMLEEQMEDKPHESETRIRRGLPEG